MDSNSDRVTAPKRKISAWLPLVVAIVSVTVTLGVWHALRNQEHVQVERVVELATYSIEADLLADMNIRIRELADLALLWQISETPRKNEFNDRAALYVSQVPGCVAIGWVSPNYKLAWTAPLNGDVYIRRLLAADNKSTRSALESTLLERGPLVGATVAISRDERIVPVWVPVFAKDRFQGYVVGIFRVRTLLDDITADHADLGYQVVVSENETPIYTLSSAIHESEWAKEAKVELPGNEWRLKIWPGPKALPDTMPLSRLVLLVGLMMALQLTFTVFLALRERASAEQVEVVNRELTAENHERQKAEESLHNLSGRLLTLQDDERRRIARELHDSTAQVLYGLSLRLRLLSESLGPNRREDRDALTASMELADECVRDIRTMSYLLHPPSLDDLGLLPALRGLAKGFTERSGIPTELDLPDNFERLPRDLETAMFRIVQESLSNVHRHSGSKTAWISLSRTSDQMTLTVRDEGRGMRSGVLNPGAELGVGIAGMRERVRQLRGRLEIRSSEFGTEVVATLPVATEASSSLTLITPHKRGSAA